MTEHDILVEVATRLEQHWNTRPLCVLACAGYSDQHWQMWHPDDYAAGGMPAWTITGGRVEQHPDSTR